MNQYNEPGLGNSPMTKQLQHMMHSKGTKKSAGKL